MRFEFEAQGDKLIARKLLRYADRAVHAQPAFEAMADTLRGYEKRLFDSQGASGGARWDDLADSTRRGKAGANLDPRVLHATLALRKSLTEEHHPDHEEIVTENQLIFGSTVPYARYHQKGEGVPKRRPLQYTEPQKKYLLKKLQRYLATGEV
jgi:phage gpG-like protein